MKNERNSDGGDSGFSLRMSRRNFIAVLGVSSASLFVGKTGLELGSNIIENRQELVNSAKFIKDRKSPSYSESYLPTDPETVLPREVSDQVYDRLNLAERYPNTLSKDSFFSISQKIGRIASIYFHPERGQDQESQSQEFYRFNEGFLKKIQQYSDLLDVDFVATLLMWQVSGSNTSSVKALKEDVQDERIRVGLGVAKNLMDSSSATFLVDSIRKVNSLKEDTIDSWYYAMPRVEGAVSLGIHDIETIMILRGLKDLEDSEAVCWPDVKNYMQNRCPEFIDKSAKYIEIYDRFEKQSESIAGEVQSSEATQDYISKFYNTEELESFLTDGENVDSYQFTKTTVFWAKVNEQNTKVTTYGGYQTRSEIIENRALEETIDYYLKLQNPTAFFLDQFENPRMIKKLRQDADNGNTTAKELLGKCESLMKLGDEVIAIDRDVSAEIVGKNLEEDIDFQILTGVAHSRWLLRDAYERVHGKRVKKITFDDPNELAYCSFLGSSNREAAPSYQLAGSRPLDRATLTFVPLDLTYQTMSDFVSNVYQKYEPEEPRKDFKKFARYMLELFEKPLFNRLTGTNRYILDDDPKMGEFIDESEKFGVYKNIFTLPHSSWMRSLEATVGYIAEVTKNKNTS